MNRRSRKILSAWLAVAVAGGCVQAASWTALKKPPLAAIWPELLLTDGSVMVLSNTDHQTWMKLTPDAQGNYANGTWSVIPGKMITPRLDFASQVLPNGKLWILGGEYSGVGIPENDTYLAEIFDPATNTWAPAAPFPNITGCAVFQFGGTVTSGSTIVTNIASTAGWQVGWGISAVNGSPIPAGTTIASIDSATQIHLSVNATQSGGIAFTLSNSKGTVSFTAPSCAGDLISILLPGPKILTGEFVGSNSFLYDPGTDTWTQGPAKSYVAGFAEEGWGRMADGTVLTYDIRYSNTKGAGYAEKYDPVANRWSPVSPVDGTAKGTLPVLAGGPVKTEMGPLMRLQDDRIFLIGGNGHTALYTPSTNTWAAGPDMMGTLAGQPFLYAADDAPAAVLPNGHVLLSGDAGNGVASAGAITAGSPVVTGIASTAQLLAGWAASGTGIPAGATIKSIDSASQVTLSAAATATASSAAIQFGGVYSKPTQLFDFDPAANTMTPIAGPANDNNLNTGGYTKMMLMLPSGQVLFFDNSAFWLYTPDGAASAALLPQVSSITANGKGGFTLTGSQLNGQSAGAAYGDDEQNDTSFPLISLTSASGSVYYAKSTNWSYIGVGGGFAQQTVDFTLSAQTTPGAYTLIVSGAGIQSNPVAVTLSADLSTIGFTPPVSISAVEAVGGTRAALAAGQWAAIYGRGLANTQRPWGDADFTNGTAAGSPLPTALDGVSVTVGGKAAAVYYISPTQIDFLVPGVAAGSAAVVVNNNGLASTPFNTTIESASPVFFSYAAGTILYASAVHLDGTLVGDPAVVPGTTPAHAGEIVELFGSGLGAAAAGTIVTPTAFPQAVTVTAGSFPLTVLGAALVAAGEFQVNVQLPANLAAGTYPLTMTVPNGTTGDSGVSVVLAVGP